MIFSKAKILLNRVESFLKLPLYQGRFIRSAKTGEL